MGKQVPFSNLDWATKHDSPPTLHSVQCNASTTNALQRYWVYMYVIITHVSRQTCESYYFTARGPSTTTSAELQQTRHRVHKVHNGSLFREKGRASSPVWRPMPTGMASWLVRWVVHWSSCLCLHACSSWKSPGILTWSLWYCSEGWQYPASGCQLSASPKQRHRHDQCVESSSSMCTCRMEDVKYM